MTRIPYTDGGSDRDTSNRSYEVSYDLDADEAPSTAVVRTVATVTNTSPLDLDPLYEAIDPDHLDGLFRRDDTPAVRIEISFSYGGCEVTMTQREVHVRTVEDDA